MSNEQNKLFEHKQKLYRGGDYNEVIKYTKQILPIQQKIAILFQDGLGGFDNIGFCYKLENPSESVGIRSSLFRINFLDYEKTRFNLGNQRVAQENQKVLDSFAEDKDKVKRAEIEESLDTSEVTVKSFDEFFSVEMFKEDKYVLVRISREEWATELLGCVEAINTEQILDKGMPLPEVEGGIEIPYQRETIVYNIDKVKDPNLKKQLDKDKVGQSEQGGPK